MTAIADQPHGVRDGMDERAAALADALSALPQLAADLNALTDRDLTSATRTTLELMARAEACVVAMTTEALERGCVDRSTASGAAQWISRLAAGESTDDLAGSPVASGPLVPLARPAAAALEPARTHSQGPTPARSLGLEPGTTPGFPGLEPGHATRLAELAEAGRWAANSALTTAVVSASVTTTVARTALRHVDKLATLLPKSYRSEIFSFFLALPPGAGARTARELTKQLIARYGPENELEHKEALLGQHESVSWGEMPCGMVQLVAELTPDNAALVRHAIDALAGPSPSSTCCDDVHHRHSAGARAVEQDTRSPRKRRADALLLLIERAARVVDENGSISSSGSARVVVTVDHEHLIGKLRGLGRTDLGEAIGIGTVRRLACDAAIIPMVLGSDSEPLDVGREKRLVDKGLRRAVFERDRHCTFPGCNRPPPWCQVHHIVPWWAGGETSLSNSALLCQSHHTVVHQRGFTARASSTGVTWELRPDRMAAA